MNQSVASSELRIAVIQSSWHQDIVDRGVTSFLNHIEKSGVPRDRIDLFAVPGAFEIPLHAKLLAQSKRYQAIVACGFVVDGGIYRHEFVAHAVIDGLMRVQLDTEIPVFSVVLTPQHFHEHQTHHDFFQEHMKTKGVEAAAACAQTLASLKRLHESITALKRAS